MNSRSASTSNVAFGVAFVLIGSLVLLNEFDVIRLGWGYIVPIVLIAAGIAVLITSWSGSRD